MQLQTLRYFLDIAQTHSINQSAKKFFVSQQVMSKSIKNLEIELAVKLLNRTKTGVTLTLAGEVLLNRAQEIIAAYDELCDELLPFQQPTTDCRGNITVYITPKLSELFYELLLVKLPQELPRCSISLHTMESEKIVQKQYFNKTEIGLITVGLENFVTLYRLGSYLMKPLVLVVKEDILFNLLPPLVTSALLIISDKSILISDLP